MITGRKSVFFKYFRGSHHTIVDKKDTCMTENFSELLNVKSTCWLHVEKLLGIIFRGVMYLVRMTSENGFPIKTLENPQKMHGFSEKPGKIHRECMDSL